MPRPLAHDGQRHARGELQATLSAIQDVINADADAQTAIATQIGVAVTTGIARAGKTVQLPRTVTKPPPAKQKASR